MLGFLVGCKMEPLSKVWRRQKEIEVRHSEVFNGRGGERMGNAASRSSDGKIVESFERLRVGGSR